MAIYAVTFLVKAKDEEQVEEYAHEVFGSSAWFEVEEFPYGVRENDLVADLEADPEGEEE
jgi:hypothetical protein